MNPENKIYQDYQFLWKHKKFLFLFILFWIVNILDFVLTYIGIEFHGLREGSPFFSHIINVDKNYGLVAVFKFYYTVTTSFLIYFIFKHYSKFFGYFLITLVDVFFAGIVWIWLISIL